MMIKIEEIEYHSAQYDDHTIDDGDLFKNLFGDLRPSKFANRGKGR